jgi:hypothetical protein
MRRTIPRFALVGSLLILAGCDSRPSGSMDFRFEANDYQFEHDGEQKRVTIARGLVRVVRYPEDIEVFDGRLWVGRRDYGAVAKKDKIFVNGVKVAVNGQERQPVSP